jgi:single-strand DNA-binding protein
MFYYETNELLQHRRGRNVARDLNKVQLTGRLGADPEMRFTAQGSARTSFRMASNRSWRSADGQTHEDTQWFRIVAWARLAEICNEYLSKASHVYIEGRLQTRRWTDENGQSRSLTEVVASDIILLDSRPGRPAQAGDRHPTEHTEAPPPQTDPPAPSAPPAGGTVRGRGLRRRLASIVENAPPEESRRSSLQMDEQDLPL